MWTRDGRVVGRLRYYVTGSTPATVTLTIERVDFRSKLVPEIPSFTELSHESLNSYVVLVDIRSDFLCKDSGRDDVLNAPGHVLFLHSGE